MLYCIPELERKTPPCRQKNKRYKMSYETVIEQVKMLPEPLLATVSGFIKSLEAEQSNFTKKHIKHSVPNSKQAFFSLAGKIHLDQKEVTELREASLV